jgi:hypothetical protein
MNPDGTSPATTSPAAMDPEATNTAATNTAATNTAATNTAATNTAATNTVATNRETSDPVTTDPVTTDPSPEATTLERLTTQFVERYREILEGIPEGEPTWVTSGGREGGLYGTIADIDAEEASRDVAGSSIAAHTEHLRWAIDLANGYFQGVEPPMDWSASWAVKMVDDAAWRKLQSEVRRAGDELMGHVTTKHGWVVPDMVNGALASYAHAAYHLGAIRQMKKIVRG